jgi:hypothetical protein
MFDITGKTLKPVSEARSSDEMERWWNLLAEEGRAKKAIESLQKSMTSTEIEALARQVFEEISVRAVDAGVSLPKEYILRLIGELSGMGPLLELIARSDIEDIAINLGHIYVYTTTNGWEHAGPAPDGIGDALRVMIDRAGQRAPTPVTPLRCVFRIIEQHLISHKEALLYFVKTDYHLSHVRSSIRRISRVAMAFSHRKPRIIC